MSLTFTTMADMDTYDEQRGYEGNYSFSSTNASNLPKGRYGYYGHSEIIPAFANITMNSILVLFEKPLKLTFSISRRS